MNEQGPHAFRSQLRPSPRPAIVVLVALSMALILVGSLTSNRVMAPKVLDLVLPLFGLAVLSWLLVGWQEQLGRWVTVAAYVAAILLVGDWLATPEYLASMGIATALSMVMISIPGAAIVATVQTVTVVLVKQGDAGISSALMAGTLISVWGVFVIMCAVERPTRSIAQWAWDYYSRAQRLLGEARDRQAELRKALKDLSTANVQLRRLNQLAQSLRQHADDARTAKGQFVANVSHELRTPLNMILGFSEMIMQAPETYGERIPPTLLADLEVIYRNAEHLSSLIDDVLDLSQVEVGEVALVKERLRLGEIIDEATAIVRPLMSSKNLWLKTDVPGDLPPVLCDRTRIREVLLNLLSNAGRFTERGGVHVRAQHDENAILVGVSDTGPGIASEDLDKVFRPFQQLDGSIRRRYGGTGLGLAISKRFVELHDGTMWLESVKGEGTTVFFRLPLAPPKPLQPGALRWLAPESSYQTDAQPSTAPVAEIAPRLVVCDDAGSLERLLSRYMTGAEIAVVPNLNEAAAEMSRTPARALVFNAPSVSEMLQDLGSSFPLPDGAPAIICSIPGTHRASDALGASDYLLKPVSREALLSTVDRLAPEGGTVLIVDDEPGALQLFGRMLSSSDRGYRVLLARDGGEAMEVSRKRRPDLILLDLIMPHIDGFQLLETRRQDPMLREVPVVVVSARDPTGQPIVSNALAVARRGGLSAQQVLKCVDAISQILSVTA